MFGCAVKLVLVCAKSVFFTSLAFPTWQVCVRDQLEASNTITFPPPTDTHSWPGIQRHTHTCACSTYQLFLNTLSQTYGLQLPVFTFSGGWEEMWIPSNSLIRKTSCSKRFFCSLTPPRLHLTVRFPPAYSMLFKSTAGGRKESNILCFIGGEAERDRGTERRMKELGETEKGRGEWRAERGRWGESTSELAKGQELNSVTYIQTREGGRAWIDRFVLLTSADPRELTPTLCGHHWVWVSMSVLVLRVSLPPAGHLSGPRWSLHWRPRLYRAF